jgi:hypothetical protein
MNTAYTSATVPDIISRAGLLGICVFSVSGVFVPFASREGFGGIPV